MEIKENKLISAVLLIFLFIGLIGFFSPFSVFFKEISSYNLLLTFLLALISFRSDIKNFIVTFFIIFLIGFSAEQIGVHSGYLFGNYYYSENLGIHIYNVPVTIGINWAILSIGAWHLTKQLSRYKLVNILIGGLIMVIFDYAMEPTAIELNYWKWKNDIIPFSNYLSWFLISIPILFICSKFQGQTSGISKTIFISQFIFFVILSIKFSWF